MGAEPDTRPPALCLLGPTASGKTGLALELAERVPCGLISVDSAQVYRGLDIGTAKPSAQLRERHPHYLVDIRDPAQPYSAAEFRRDAISAMGEVVAAGRLPVLVGGTMLYYRALQRGLADLPSADPGVRAEIDALARRDGWPAVHARLAQVDPDSAARIRPTDPQRLQRALEVYLVSGRSLSELHRQSVQPEPLPCRLRWLAIAPEDRAVLHRRIESRFDAMLNDGFLDEVECLYRRGDLSPALPSIRSVGYRQAWAWLDGELGYTEMRDRAIMATRQLAKRQYTWLRSWTELEWVLLDAAGRPVGDSGGDPVRVALKLLASAAM